MAKGREANRIAWELVRRHVAMVVEKEREKNSALMLGWKLWFLRAGEGEVEGYGVCILNRVS
jgi:hypothetical protein